MPRFAANLTMMYQEFPFLERFAAAARDGFNAVEYLFPDRYFARDLKARLDARGLVQVLFNAPPGEWAAGERGIAALPGREDEFRRSIETALERARILGNTRLHVMAGLIDPSQPHQLQRGVYLKNIAWAASEARADGMTIVIEPINRRDMPGFFLTRQDEAQSICAAIGASNLRVQFDCYHCQITEGDLSFKLTRDIANVGHIQVAGVSDRHEPDVGELNFPYLFDLIDSLGYEGWIGCEYEPSGATSAGLQWMTPFMKTTQRVVAI